jgi:hypothetical protein
VSDAWPIATAGDARFAAVADLLSLWPPGPLPGVAELAAALRAHLAPHGLRLVEATAPPPRRKKAPFDPRSIYEIRIAEAGEIPTRPDNLHDVCNALSWAAFPTAKWALTCRIAELQKARMAQDGSQPGTRDREHDRLALLDEGGLLRLRDAEGRDGATGPGGPGGPRELGVLVGHALWQHAALGHRGIRAAVAPAPLPAGAAAHLPSFARASCREVRAAVDAAWLALVRSPDTLHAAMGGRAGEPIDEAALWRPAELAAQIPAPSARAAAGG